MIRRFETYAFLPGTTDEARRRVGDVLARAGRFIPEVLDSAIGWNRSDAPSELVWEQAYQSAESYRRYMVHPYHAEMIDRYVLPDSPERVVEPITGAGLFGYYCAEPGFRLPPGGARRVVLLRLDEETGGAGDAAALAERAERAAADAGAMGSMVGANTMAVAWFDGETPLPVPPPRWTHVWELGFERWDALERHVEGPGREAPAALGASRWAELRYEVLPPD